jgi:hypothetical protein
MWFISAVWQTEGQDCVQNVALTVKTVFRQQNSRNFPTTFWKLSLQLPDKGTLRKM